MNKIEFGDCREIMQRWILSGVKAQICVTSPPYFGLRDYGVDGQFGLEKTPDQYVKNLVETFRLVWDILEDDGTLWLNLGDSYAGSWGNQGRKDTRGTQRPINSTMIQPVLDARYPNKQSNTGKIPEGSGLKPKDIIGIPWMVAFALRADGWYLRQDIIWAKPNPMPESVQDRCTKSHEYIFMLSKSPKYYYDHQAIKTPSKTPLKNPDANKSTISGGAYGRHVLGNNIPEKDRRTDKQRGHSRRHDGFNDRWDLMTKEEQQKNGANKRDVWFVSTKPYKGAHFATFPADLIEPCVLAGSRPGDIVFDPFMGSGTTAQVAKQHNRQYLGCELNPEYKVLINKRLQITEDIDDVFGE